MVQHLLRQTGFFCHGQDRAGAPVYFPDQGKALFGKFEIDKSPVVVFSGVIVPGILVGIDIVKPNAF